MAEEEQARSTFPPPPSNFVLGAEQQPPPPPEADSFVVFGGTDSLRTDFPALTEFGQDQLYDADADPRHELKRLARQAAAAMVETLDAMCTQPSRVIARFERFELVLRNFHHLLARCRELQAMLWLHSRLEHEAAQCRTLAEQLSSETSASRDTLLDWARTAATEDAVAAAPQAAEDIALATLTANLPPEVASILRAVQGGASER